ncbi:DUF4255 domain-containing protein [Streptomyces sp. NBC_01381]|uniref:DUF4255 domain-containing protein n=1 Tax=Streptomyces sp. NBC_01381 TaxID=2903845 RepID=UPI00224D8528|nr:DUF4255 domain-containing protein [Streptomyces sp. NBC_01381]MCX4672828.1 DUF4255 domain-containing protein [Streptomyces sp. NBC_01381]
MVTPANAFMAVDETLKRLTDAGFVDAGISVKPSVTVGPLDRDEPGPRLNWFLYRVSPNPAFRSMEHPGAGSRTSMGAPPLALQLHYLLSAYGATPTTGGDSEQIIHTSLAAVMRRLHESPIVGAGSPFLPDPEPVLVEPLRITLEEFDLENYSKLWTASTKPLRLSVAYTVSLVVIEPRRTYTEGPPVSAVRTLSVTSTGPRLDAPRPDRIGGDETTSVRVEGAVPSDLFLLSAEPGDPAGHGPLGWPMVVVGQDREVFTLRLPRHDLVPAVRELVVHRRTDGLSVSRGRVALAVAPVVVSVPGDGQLTVGDRVTLTTAHCAPGTELFFDGVAVPVVAVTPTSVTFDVPDLPGRPVVSLRCRRLAGRPRAVEVRS